MTILKTNYKPTGNPEAPICKVQIKGLEETTFYTNSFGSKKTAIAEIAHWAYGSCGASAVIDTHWTRTGKPLLLEIEKKYTRKTCSCLTYYPISIKVTVKED